MSAEAPSLLVVGAGHAGSELAVAARHNGWSGRIVLVGDEPVPPYQRPPLSKAYLLGKADVESLALRGASVYATANIELRPGTRVRGVDRAAHVVELADGSRLAYSKLAWCAGGRPRPFVCDGIDEAAAPPNLLHLRTLADSDRIRSTARLCVCLKRNERRAPRAGSNRSGWFHSRRKTSCTISSAPCSSSRRRASA